MIAGFTPWRSRYVMNAYLSECVLNPYLYLEYFLILFMSVFSLVNVRFVQISMLNCRISLGMIISLVLFFVLLTFTVSSVLRVLVYSMNARVASLILAPFFNCTSKI